MSAPKISVTSCFSLEKLNAFYDIYKQYDEKTVKAMITCLETTLNDYPPTKDQEMMLSKIKLGDAAFPRWEDGKDDSLLRSKLGNLSNSGVQKEIEKITTNLFVSFIGMNGKILLLTATEEKTVVNHRLVYWNGKLGWILIGRYHYPLPLLLIHIDVPEYYRFAFNLFHNDDGTHKSSQLSDSLWLPPTTDKSLLPPFYEEPIPHGCWEPCPLLLYGEDDKANL
jgi:hypothetical protein